MTLSREQVERLGEFLCLENLSQTAEKFLAHDAALRERVQELEKDNAAKFLQIRKMDSDCFEHCQDWTRAQLKLNTLTTAHQQAVKERDELKQTLLVKGRFGHCEKCINHDGYVQCDKADPLALEMSAGGVVTWWKCAHCALEASLQQAVEALAGVRTELLKRWTVEYEKALDEQDAIIKRMEAMNDMYGLNLHEGLRFGAIEMDLAIRRVLKAMFTGGGGT